MDQTFQQFALDDSEDESGEDLEGSTSDILMENGVEPCLSPLSPHKILTGKSSSQ